MATTRRPTIVAMALLCLASPALAADEASLAPVPQETVYAYRVTTPDFGEIGHYVNRIRADGARTIVDTEIAIRVRVLLVTAFSLKAERRETWQDGAFVGFDGETLKNGATISLDVHAEDGGLLVEGPHGERLVPGSVMPLNPWSPHILAMTEAMSTESGRVYGVTIRDEGPVELEVEGREIEAQHYLVEGDEGAEVWFDEAGRPVRFAINEDGRVLTFTLASSLAELARAD
ncbi:MAG: hypothetical protein H6923_07590 [Alphaproteobacteria bacterium]|nr:hypothetical protein [Alphaproteobacteria bacterium]